VVNEIIAYDKIPLITVLQYDVCLVFKILMQFCSLWKASHQGKTLCHCLHNSQWHQFQQIFEVRVTVDSLRHEAHNEIYGISAFYDKSILTFHFLGVSW